MQIEWLHRDDRRECILFCTGWGMDGNPFRFLDAGGCDVCLLSDYRELQPITLEPFAGYAGLHLVAWSMGVWVAGFLLADQAAAFASSTAIGGTLLPIDKQRGIPPESYNGMLDEFNEATLAAFYRNMFDDDEQLSRFLETRPQRGLGALKAEMIAFREAFFQHGPGVDVYTQKIITSRDRIFSGRNQMRAWGKGIGTVHNWPHFPFYSFTTWRDILPAR